MCCNNFRILLLFVFVSISFVFNNYIPSIPVVLWYFFSINVFTLFLFSIDKYYALKNRKRVSEASLHFLSLAGGIFGAILAMIGMRHKLQKERFLYIQLLILFFWLISVYLVIANLEQIQNALAILVK